MIGVPVRCSIDVSVGIKLVVHESDSHLAHQLLRHSAYAGSEFWVPDFFFLEASNILWKLVQRAKMTTADTDVKLNELQNARLKVIGMKGLENEALKIALAYGITTYDALYVVAASRLGVPLVTADARLAGKLNGTPHAAELLGSLAIPPLPTPLPP